MKKSLPILLSALLAACSLTPPEAIEEPTAPVQVTEEKEEKYLNTTLDTLRSTYTALGFVEHANIHGEGDTTHTFTIEAGHMKCRVDARVIDGRVFSVFPSVDVTDVHALEQGKPILITTAELVGGPAVAEWTSVNWATQDASTLIDGVRVKVFAAGRVSAYLWFLAE